MCDILQLSIPGLWVVHLMTQSLKALNFFPSKSYFEQSKGLLHVHISQYNLDLPHLHNANIFYFENNLHVSVLFINDVH